MFDSKKSSPNVFSPACNRWILSIASHSQLTFCRIFPFKSRDCVDDVDCCLTSLYLDIRLDLHVQMYAGFWRIRTCRLLRLNSVWSLRRVFLSRNKRNICMWLTESAQICTVNSQIISLMLEVLCDKKSACWITFILQDSITFEKMCSSNCSNEVASIEQASFIESFKLSLWEVITSSHWNCWTELNKLQNCEEKKLQNCVKQ